VRLSVAIQHHESRAYLLPPLLASLGPADVVADPNPTGVRSAWRTFRRAIEETPPDCTHRLIIQDDVTVCRNFRAGIELAIASRPEDILTFWHGDQPRENLFRLQAAMTEGSPWAELNVQRFLPVVASCWPRELAECLIEFVDAQDWPAEFVADDEIAGRFARTCGVRCFTSCPSLVEHGDEVSVMLRAQRCDEGRRAAFFIGDGDPLAIDWG
jgi:hypothetical protein